MNPCRVFAQHLYSQNPQSNTAKLALYNYFKNVVDPDEMLTTNTLNLFYERALCFTHWQKNLEDLVRVVEESLETFFRHRKQNIDLSLVLNPLSFQIFEIKRANDFIKIVERASIESDSPKKFAKFKVKQNREREFAGIGLTEDNKLHVSQFYPVTRLIDGELRPLRPNIELVYDSNLKLETKGFHRLVIDQFSTLRFSQNSHAFGGIMVRGYTFNKIETVQTDRIERVPRFYYPLKRIERLFINQNSDPFYRSLTLQIEQIVSKLKSNENGALRQAQEIYDRAKIALEEIFTDDKMLRLLVRDLENTIIIKSQKSGDGAAHLESQESCRLENRPNDLQRKNLPQNLRDPKNLASKISPLTPPRSPQRRINQ